jgi:hypothetical protein
LKENREYYPIPGKMQPVMNDLIITPKTKVYDLLEAYPELEDTLIEMVSQFKKLKNPLLRKTITRVTSLQQAAGVGNIKVDELVNKLREAAGQELMEEMADMDKKYNLTRPSWYDESRIRDTIDISEMLDRGEQPVHEVMAALKKLGKDGILKVVAPFLPAPLLDKSIGLDVDHWVDNQDDIFNVYFWKK